MRNISSNNSWSGNITLGSASQISSDAGTLTLSGTITNGGFGLTAAGPITSVEELPRALAVAVEAVASGEPYLLDVVTEPR